jgi:excinuclease ABC subunit C
VILPRASEGLYLLQRVRDEAHRFAITYHRQRRSKRMTVSALDNVPGLGEVRRKALLRRFGSLKRLKVATVEEIAEVPGIGRRTAESILVAINGPAEPEAPEPTPPHPAGKDATPSVDGTLPGDATSPGDGVPGLVHADLAAERSGAVSGGSNGRAPDGPGQRPVSDLE